MGKIKWFFLAVLIIVLGACGTSSAEDGIDKIVFAGGEYDSIKVQNGIAQKIAEEGYGYETEKK